MNWIWCGFGAASGSIRIQFGLGLDLNWVTINMLTCFMYMSHESLVTLNNLTSDVPTLYCFLKCFMMRIGIPHLTCYITIDQNILPCNSLKQASNVRGQPLIIWGERGAKSRKRFFPGDPPNEFFWFASCVAPPPPDD